VLQIAIIKQMKKKKKEEKEDFLAVI